MIQTKLFSDLYSDLAKFLDNYYINKIVAFCYRIY